MFLKITLKNYFFFKLYAIVRNRVEEKIDETKEEEEQEEEEEWEIGFRQAEVEYETCDDITIDDQSLKHLQIYRKFETFFPNFS